MILAGLQLGWFTPHDAKAIPLLMAAVGARAREAIDQGLQAQLHEIETEAGVREQL